MAQTPFGESRVRFEDQLIPQNAPTPATAPAAPVVAAGARTAPSASAIYEGLKAQRRELNNQLDELQSTRREITSQMEDVSSGSTEQKALETRMTDIDSANTNVEKMLALNAAQIAQAASVPGAVVDPPRFVRQGPQL